MSLAAVAAAPGTTRAASTSIGSLQGQIARLQGELNSERARLLTLRGQADGARSRLGQLESLEAQGEQALSAQLVSGYESDRPDIVSVVLEASGFQDLLERLAFARQIQDQDVRVIDQVEGERKAVASEATRLGALEQSEQTLADQVLQQRNGLTAQQVSLVQQQIDAARLRNRKAGALVAGLQSQLSKLQAAQAAAAARAESGGPAAGASGFVFPLPKSDASPPGTWSPDDGVDISAPGNTPEYAVCSGTIVLHGIGGSGPWAPVIHCDRPLDGYGYVYYGHAGPENQLPIGTHVSAGETMSSVGPGIVGISTGPHLEIGFADSSGSPIGPSSAPRMLSLLQRAY